MAEEVLELSIEETNKLRAELGLKPLRLNDGQHTDVPTVRQSVGDVEVAPRDGEDQILEMSVDETNKLREQLGLPLLRNSSSEHKEIFLQTENLGEKEEAAKRIEQARLKREVEEGVSKVFGSSTLAAEEVVELEAENVDATLSWADKMRQQKARKESDKKKKMKVTATATAATSSSENYGASDLEGMQVRNSMADLEAGSSTVLTLADSSILQTKTFVSNKAVGLNEEEDALENIQLTERQKQQDGLRKKRLLEMGMGRAGGYAGFDDEEFEELGGTLGPSRQERGGLGNSQDYEDDDKKTRGFRIGSEKEYLANASMSDFDKVQRGKAVSLIGKSDVAPSDYMTLEEEEEERAQRRNKDAKFKKKKKKKDKKQRRKTPSGGDDEEDDEENPVKPISATGSSLLQQLEESAPAEQSSGLKKRRRGDDDFEADEEPDIVASAGRRVDSKQAKYDEIMEKGNQRTKLAFGQEKKPVVVKKETPSDTMDEEADDSFLNAALAKARRLNRLRAMNNGSSVKGAEAVVQAVNSTSVEEQNGSSKTSGTMSFSLDDTREFSRALRARTEQKKRDGQKQGQELPFKKIGVTVKDPKPDMDEMEVTVEDVEEEDVDMEELAKEVIPDKDEIAGFEGTAASSAGVGRGLSSFVNMLKTTGEITGKHGGKEELRGRAKDERNYDNYEPLDLKKVVKIGRNATDKDKEFANREIKLEYRDKHGRLLTQKEAFRDLCYQFHGHGASKKKEEKRLKQIAREQAEARLASRQISAARDGTAVGTLGALKATQKATGKAYVVHKT
ncbi:SART-1 family protein [Nitzschia inconspicua]|uniref:SART-1 family protein n=1 Tax=Nitzschia inconspicua TaxID=303405 RepID=A0A9K3PGD4_9STRA|nr:SART-1 family protein [Nitzschia inconspicua]